MLIKVVCLPLRDRGCSKTHLQFIDIIIQELSDPFPPNIKNIIASKP